MAATRDVETGEDANKRFRDELARELELTLASLAKSKTDLLEVTRTAMDLAERLDECEARLVEAQERNELKGQELVQAETTISRQHDYIQRLRQQVKSPGRLLAKRVLGPARNLVRKDAGR